MRREAGRLVAVADAAVVRKRITDLATQLGGAEALRTSPGRVTMTDAQLRQSLSDEVIREAVQNAAFPEVIADVKAARAYYVRHRGEALTQAAAVHLAAIAVRTEMVAENALARIRQGSPFAEVAHQLSIGSESRDAGGDLGLLLVSSLPPPLRKAATSAGLGPLAKPVRAGPVWYVLDIVAWRPERVIPFAKVRARIREELTRVKRAKALAAWLVKARTDALIERP